MAGSDLVGPTNWAAYKALMRDAQETFANQPITWRRRIESLDRFNEDEPLYSYTDITIKALLQYNVFRTWPITRNTDSGDIDEESLMVIINREYLGELGYLTANNNFNFSPSGDRFIISGYTYKCQGYLDSSQDDNEALWVNLILEKENKNTGDIETP